MGESENERQEEAQAILNKTVLNSPNNQLRNDKGAGFFSIFTINITNGNFSARVASAVGVFRED